MKYRVRVAAMGFFEDVDIEASSPEQACKEVLSLAKDGEITPCEAFEYSCRHDTFIDSVEDENGDYHQVPRDCWSPHDKEIAKLEAEIRRLKIKCGEDTL